MREIKFRAVMQRLDGVKYVSQAYSIDNKLSYLFDFEDNRWDKFLEMITTEERFVKLFPDDDEDLKGWSHIENIQYTNRKDKNNVEIYEGDIIKGGVYLAYEVKWDHESNGWNICNEYNIRTNYEVIGNIYENLELIKDINKQNLCKSCKFDFAICKGKNQVFGNDGFFHGAVLKCEQYEDKGTNK